MWYGTTVTAPDSIAFFGGDDYQTFWSIEPILEQFGKWNRIIDRMPWWIIVGAETGYRKDEVITERKWIENIADECKRNDIPLFMKSSLADIWGEPLIQEFTKELRQEKT